MSRDDDSRLRREQAAAKYRPDEVRLLLVAEAPPEAADRYFYFDRVDSQDSLFRYVVRALLREEPSRDKAEQLGRLRDRGVFLIDLKPDPKRGEKSLRPYVENLVARARALRPDHVITIKTNVCDLCQRPHREAGLDVSDERVPFPGSGQQTRFVDAMSRALRRIDW